MKGWGLCLLLFVSCYGDKNEPDCNLVWADEFNYTGLPDLTNWGNEVGFIRNNELQYYTDQRPENAIVMNGNLLIITRKESYETANMAIGGAWPGPPDVTTSFPDTMFVD